MKKYLMSVTALLMVSLEGTNLQAVTVRGFDLCASGFPLPITPSVQTLINQGCMQASTDRGAAFETFENALERLTQETNMLKYLLVMEAWEQYDEPLSAEQQSFVSKQFRNVRV